MSLNVKQFHVNDILCVPVCKIVKACQVPISKLIQVHTYEALYMHFQVLPAVYFPKRFTICKSSLVAITLHFVFKVLHNGMLQEIPHPTAGTVRMPGKDI